MLVTWVTSDLISLYYTLFCKNTSHETSPLTSVPACDAVLGLPVTVTLDSSSGAAPHAPGWHLMPWNSIPPPALL